MRTNRMPLIQGGTHPLPTIVCTSLLRWTIGDAESGSVAVAAPRAHASRLAAAMVMLLSSASAIPSVCDMSPSVPAMTIPCATRDDTWPVTRELMTLASHMGMARRETWQVTAGQHRTQSSKSN